MLDTENLSVNFKGDGVRRIAELAIEDKENKENIGACRLHTILKRLLEEISFEASDLGAKEETIVIDKAFVDQHLSELSQNEDLSRFIL